MIEGRLIESQSPVDRDGYDIAYALKYHPDIFQQATEGTHRGAFLNLVTSLVGVTGRGRNILSPSDPALARDPWLYIAENFEIILNGYHNDKTCID